MYYVSCIICSKTGHNTKGTLAKATIQSKMEYGLHLASTTAQTHLTKLERVQNEAMRIITGAAKPTACDSMRYWLGFMGVIESTTASASITGIPESPLHPTHPLRAVVENEEDRTITQRLKTAKSWMIGAKEAVEDISPVENILFRNRAKYQSSKLSMEKIGDRT